MHVPERSYTYADMRAVSMYARLTQSEIARVTGLSRQRVSSLLKGR